MQARRGREAKLFSMSTGLMHFAFLQILLGALVAGIDAGRAFPTWPDMNGALLPDVLMDSSQWHLDAFKHYDTNAFAPAIVQFVHRGVAYILTAVVLIFTVKAFKQQPVGPAKVGFAILPVLLLVQVTLGIVTVINCIGTIPVSWGVLHQAGGVLLLANLVFVRHFCLPKGEN